jgi:hypothetical protein
MGILINIILAISVTLDFLLLEKVLIKKNYLLAELRT